MLASRVNLEGSRGGIMHTGKFSLALQECGVGIDELLRIDIFDSDAAHVFGIF
jgi:hypothetical protein